MAGGAYYIKGGSKKLVNKLSKLIIKNGGKILLNSNVDNIVFKQNTAVGVTCSTGRKKQKILLPCDKVIANAAIPHVWYNLVNGDELDKDIKKYKRSAISCSLLVLYIIYNKRSNEIINPYYSRYIGFEKKDFRIEEFNKYVKSNDYRKKIITIIDYGIIDSGLSKNNFGLISVATIDYIDNWSNLPSHEYREKKENIARIFINRINQEIPNLKENIIHYEVSTPKTIFRYTNNNDGTPYGFSQTSHNGGIYRIKRQSSVSNLYYASAWRSPGGGFTGAITGGYLTAIECLRGSNNP
jgi:phytoene dehydrogenase-like protein